MFSIHSHAGIIDFAHEGPGFPTWHRLYLLWCEREIQLMLGDDTFSFPYWDWRNPDHREILFRRNRLGVSVDGIVEGEIFDNWYTVCWNRCEGDLDTSVPCDLSRDFTGLLRRCPVEAACEADNMNWPTYEHIDETVSMVPYDEPSFDRFARGGFRNFFEGFVIVDECDPDDTMCTPGEVNGTTVGIRRLLHNTVSDF